MPVDSSTKLPLHTLLASSYFAGNSILTYLPVGKLFTDTSFPSYEVISMLCVFLNGNYNFLPVASVSISVGILFEDVATQFTLVTDAA